MSGGLGRLGVSKSRRLAPVGDGNESVVMLGSQLHDGAVRRGFMRLDLAFELSDLILQLAARGVECIS